MVHGIACSRSHGKVGSGAFVNGFQIEGFATPGFVLNITLEGKIFLWMIHKKSKDVVDFLINEHSAKSLFASTIDFGNYFQHLVIHSPAFAIDRISFFFNYAPFFSG